MNIAEALQAAVTRLQSQGELAQLESEMLLADTLSQSRTHLKAWPEKQLTEDALHVFFERVARREAGEPIAHILGSRDFWTLTLAVNSHTLIPRPETEMLVEQVLQLIPEESASIIADLGTGSGAIALAVASERPHCRVHATDLSGEALQVASKNAAVLDIGNVLFHQGSWFEALPDELQFDLIVSNPPYIAGDDAHLEQGDLRFEPRMALTPEGDGLDSIRCIAAKAAARLTAQGWLLFEHGYDQGEAVAEIMRAQGFASVKTLQDLAGCERVTLGQKSSLD